MKKIIELSEFLGDEIERVKKIGTEPEDAGYIEGYKMALETVAVKVGCLLLDGIKEASEQIKNTEAK